LADFYYKAIASKRFSCSFSNYYFKMNCALDTAITVKIVGLFVINNYKAMAINIIKWVVTVRFIEHDISL
jgi:hypothetical protein